MDVVQDDHIGVDALLALVEDVTEDDSGVSRRHLDGRLEVDEIVRANILCRWSLNNLEVTEGCKLYCKILQCLGCLVDKQNIENDVKLMNLE